MNTSESGINLHVIYARNEHARRIIAGCMSVMPVAAEMWQQVDGALSDVPAMGAILMRLADELADTRMDRANLLAAMRATMSAYADGEADPLSYLRDELDTRQMPSQDHGRAS